jgi:DNA-binding transcriptional LysR family regulator
MATEVTPTPAGDVAERALQSLVDEIDRCVDELMQARARADSGDQTACRVR